MKPSTALALLMVLALGVTACMGLTTRELSGDSLTTFLIRQHAAKVYQGEYDAAWNPFLQMGYPFHAESEGALFYPVQWILYALSGPLAAYALTLFVHMAAMALFSFLYLGRVGISREGSVLAAIAYMGCGYFVRHYGHEWSYRAGAWFPLILYFVHRVSVEGDRRFLIPCALAIGVQWLAGHFNIAYWTLLAAGFYVLLAARHGRGESPNRWRNAALLGVAVALGLGLAAVQILPSHELAGLSHRAEGVGLRGFFAFSFLPLWATRLLFPRVGEFYPGVASPHETDVYIGVLPLLLAWAGWTHRQWGFRGLLAPMLMGSILSVLGIFFLPNLLLYWFLPGYSSFRGPVRAIFLVSFFLCAFAGAGFDAVRSMAPAPPRPARRFAALAIGVALMLLGAAALHGTLGDLFGSSVSTVSAASGWPRSAPVHAANFKAYLQELAANAQPGSGFFWGPLALAAAAWAWLRFAPMRRWSFPLALTILVADQVGYARALGRHGLWRQDFPRPFDAQIRFLQADPEPHRIFCWPSPEGGRSGVDLVRFPGTFYFQPFGIANAASTTPRLACAASVGVLWRDKTHSFSPRELYDSLDLLGGIGVKYVLSDEALSDGRLECVFDGPLKIYRNRSFAGRAYLTDDAALEPARRPPGAARITKDTGAEVIVETDARRPAALVLADNPYPAWRAFVAGKEVPIRTRPDGLCRVVDIPAGRIQVRFAYASGADAAGLRISLLSAGILALWGMLGIFRWAWRRGHGAF